ncbi:MAG: radical SAM protein [Bacteroidales bacterium]|nr:radical SAM protein [Bacteroidales bacterium]
MKRAYSLLFIRKTANAIWSYCGYLLSAITHKPHCYGMPFLFSVEIASCCNLRCPQCPSGTLALTRRRGTMPMDLYKTIIDEISGHALYTTLYLQGEPFLNKDFCEMAEYAHKKRIYTATSTNGQLINSELAERIVASGLDKIIVSVDGATQESYEKYRIGGQIDKALNAIKLIVDEKKKSRKSKPLIEMQMLLFKHNENEVDAARDLAKTYGADKFTLKTAQIYDYKQGNELIPTNESFSRYIKLDDGTYSIKRTLHNRCARVFTSACFTIDGDVTPCSFDKNAEHSFGNIKQSSLKEIWHGRKANEFRATILKHRTDVDICTNCVY